MYLCREVTGLTCVFKPDRAAVDVEALAARGNGRQRAGSRRLLEASYPGQEWGRLLISWPDSVCGAVSRT
jgi:hypothetical protein